MSVPGFYNQDIFQLLNQAEATGKLVLEGESERGRVYFHEGRVIYARTDASMERIGDALVRQGGLEPTQLEGARIQAECKDPYRSKRGSQP